MVGGIVVGISRTPERTHVTVAECPHYPKHGIAERPDKRPNCPNPDECSVYTDERKRKTGEHIEISVGDSLWWQSGDCFWTPKERHGKEGGRGGVDYDIILAKLGYSH